MRLSKHVVQGAVTFLLLISGSSAQSPSSPSKTFDQQGLAFDYVGNWELSGQPTGEVQQLVLIEKALDAQIMVIVPRNAITSSKEEELATQSVVDPTIKRLIKQYEDAGIALERNVVAGEIAGMTAHGLQLRFSVDGLQGFTDIYWLVLNQRLVQMIFVRPERTSSQTSPCWDLIRRTLKIHKI